MDHIRGPRSIPPLFRLLTLSLIGAETKPVVKPAEPSAADNPGNFQNFPEIDPQTIKGLVERGITELFPVQYNTFRKIENKEDMIVRDLTGSGKTLGFCLPIVTRLRRERLFG